MPPTNADKVPLGLLAYAKISADGSKVFFEGCLLAGRFDVGVYALIIDAEGPFVAIPGEQTLMVVEIGVAGPSVNPVGYIAIDPNDPIKIDPPFGHGQPGFPKVALVYENIGGNVNAVDRDVSIWIYRISASLVAKPVPPLLAPSLLSFPPVVHLP